MKLFKPAALASLLFLSSLDAFAGYAQLAPPPAFSSVGGVSTMQVGAAANGARYAGGYVVANASLQVGARAVTVPVAYRVAANAAAFAVTRMNPWIAGATLVASAIPYFMDWFTGTDLEVTSTGLIRVRGIAGSGFDLDASTIQDGRTLGRALSDDASWITPGSIALIRLGHDSYCYWVGGSGPITRPAFQIVNSLGNQITRYCLGAGGRAVPKNGTDPRPATQADLNPLVSKPLNPAALPAIDQPLPVDPMPVINPATQPAGDVVIGPNGNPAPQLQPSTMRVPDGAPVPNPNTSPQTYTQPWLEIVPAPTPDSPYRVDVRPVTTIVNSPVTPTDPVVNPTTPATPAEPDLCQKYPTIMACQPEGDFADSGLPSIPQLYTRKYPDGMVGIWDQKKQAMRDTSIGQLASQIMPAGVGDGGCPQWSIPLDVGFKNYGTVPIGIPCEYWGYLRIIMIIGSLFLARALIFGG